MTRYQVDSDAVASATAAAHGYLGRIESEVGGLYALLVDLQNAWSGPAAAAFPSVLTEWRATQQRVAEGIAVVNQGLAAAGQQYAEVEVANARLFAGH
jgi:early secretory antigenic target protein ESAT-6